MALGAGGTYLSASSASKKRKELASKTGEWLPTIPQNESDYFDALQKYQPRASALARTIGQEEMDAALALREQAIPGIGKGISEGAEALFPLLKGELPPAVLDAFRRSGAANSVGLGFGGSGFGDLNTALFGARGALAGMQLGYGMLPSLLGATPNINTPTAMSFLGNVMSPQDRTNTQLQVRGQNLGISQAVAGMPTSSEVWGNFLSSTGGMMLGGAMGGGGMGGGGGGSSTGPGGYFGSGGFGPTIRNGDPSTMRGASRLFG